VGTISQNLRPHIHISLSDGKGSTIGGHLPSLDERETLEKSGRFTMIESGCYIYTTAEITLAEHYELIFKREYSNETTFDELVIYRRKVDNVGTEL